VADGPAGSNRIWSRRSGADPARIHAAAPPVWVDGAVTRYADPAACPDCRAALPWSARGCPSCGLDLSTDSARELFSTLTRADELLTRMRAARGVAKPGYGEPTAESPPLAAPTPPAPGGAGPSVAPAGPTPEGPGLRPSAVPKILLTLGALCLLGAALVFLVVSWSRLGVGGRTAVLLLFTLAMGALTAWSARRGFRGAVEALGLVTLGMAALDVVGAESAGWLGEQSLEAFLLLLGALLVAAGIGASRALSATPAGGFVGGELAALLGSVLVVGSAAAIGDEEPVLPLALALLGLGAATAVALRWDRRVAAPAVGAVTAAGWLALLSVAVDETSGPDGVTLTTTYAEGAVVGLVVTTALPLLLAVLPAVVPPVRLLAGAAAYFALTLTVTLPALDEDTPWSLLTVMAATLVATAVLLLAPRPARAVGLGVAAPGVLALAVAGVGWALRGLDGYLSTAALAWEGTLDGAVQAPEDVAYLPDPWLLPPAVLTIAAAGWAAWGLRATVEPGQRRVPLLWLGVLAVAAGGVAVLGYPVPVWTLLVGLLLAAAVATVAGLDRLSPIVPGVAGLLLVLAQPLSWSDEVLTAGCLAVTLLLTGVAHWQARHALTGLVAGAAAVISLAGLTWTLGAVLDQPEERSGLVATALVALVAVGRGSLPGDPHGEAERRLAVEATCGLVALPLLALGAGAADRPATWAAIQLTVLGAAATALALLRPDRRPVAVLGGLLLVMATWLRLADIGVSEPEPYTLPSAVALLAIGLWQLRRRPALPTRVALAPGLALALVPSLLWVLAEADHTRALLLGLACLGLVLTGAWLRWSAPLVAGATVGALVAVRVAAPYVDAAVPRWSMLAAAGALMVLVALTWESRMADARRAAAYLDRLR
jgi:hypothetical protein